MNFIKFSILLLTCTLTVQAQLMVSALPLKIIGRKAVVSLAMTNDLTESIESAHAVCFLLDDQGKMIGQSSKWVIGGMKDRPALQTKAGTTFNFIITSPQPLVATNVSAKISFTHILLEGGRQADVKHDVLVIESN